MYGSLLKKDDDEEGFKSDFPQSGFGKNDYKKIKENHTFGNDKVITHKGFRPSYGIAEGEDVQVLVIPLKSIEDCIKQLANSGENLEKTLFFKQFPWFNEWTNALRTKFNGCVKKREFYPGQFIIKEGTNEQYLYCIVEGSCKYIILNSASKLTDLQYADDPCRKKRDEELKKFLSPYK